MTVLGRCHCGNVRLEVPSEPEWVGSCNCSYCRKVGWLVAYYHPDQVTIIGDTQAYIWGDRMIGIHHCPRCGCLTHWASLGEDFGKMGVSARLLEGFDTDQVEIRLINNAD